MIDCRAGDDSHNDIDISVTGKIVIVNVFLFSSHLSHRYEGMDVSNNLILCMVVLKISFTMISHL